MSSSSHAIGCAILLVFCLVTIPPPSSGFGMLHGGNRDSGIAEILAAGLITRLLLEQNEQDSRPVFQAIFHPIMEYMMPMHHHHAPQASMHHPMMNTGGMRMVHPYAAMASLHRPQYLMSQALMAQASQQQALAARLGQEIKALEAQESLLEAYLARNQQRGVAESAISQLLVEDDDDMIPAAALILETAEILEEDDEEESSQSPTSAASRPEMMEMAGSEPESRYILPRIVRHFVQRLMRRAEQH